MILSIESSCDDSSIAVTEIDSNRLIYHTKISQEREHSVYGGVVPELASRLHAVALPKLLDGAKEYLPRLKAVAVTTHPGLSVTLNEGLMMAKSVAALQDIPLIAVNHLKGHIFSLFIDKDSIIPLLVLLVSGGHTQIIRVESLEKMEILATSMDDSVGESYDKCAKMMGLGYPGGPIVEKLAKNGDENRFDLPVPLINSALIAFSLSGLKNAVRLTVEKLGGANKMSEQDRCDLSASFQKAVKLHLLQKANKIFAKVQTKDFAIVGGVSANSYIRNAFEQLCKKHNKTMHTVPMEYCSDNAAMIGRYAVDAYHNNLFVELCEIEVQSSKKKQNKFLS